MQIIWSYRNNIRYRKVMWISYYYCLVSYEKQYFVRVWPILSVFDDKLIKVIWNISNGWTYNKLIDSTWFLIMVLRPDKINGKSKRILLDNFQMFNPFWKIICDNDIRIVSSNNNNVFPFFNIITLIIKTFKTLISTLIIIFVCFSTTFII